MNRTLKTAKNKKTIPPSHPLVLIEWVDSSRLGNAWVDWDEIPSAYLHLCVTVGFLACETKEAVILIPTIADIENPDNRHTYGGMLIPRSAIKRQRRLREGSTYFSVSA